MHQSFFLVVFFSCGAFVQAHQEPGDTIHKLTHQIQQGENVVRLHFERAVKYRSIGNLRLAIRDLNEVLGKNPKHTRSLEILGEIYTSQNLLTKAESTLKTALETTSNKSEIASLHMCLSQVFLKKENLPEALQYNKKALSIAPEKEVDWYLLLAAIQLRCGQLEPRASTLKKAMKSIPSAVLTHAWIDAEIDAGNIKKVDKIVQRELTDSRYRSAWLIRLARINKRKNKPYRVLLRSAIKEIDTRLNPNRPDITILIERCSAYHLLGNSKQASSDLFKLQELNVPQDDLNHLKWLLSDNA